MTMQSHHSPPAMPTPIHTIVLYHANCNDGFAAAWAAREHLGDDGVRYQPVRYGKPMPSIAGTVVAVYIVDFSYPRAVLDDLNQKVAKLQVIDHHRSAAADLAGLPYAHFDQQKSGAILTWEHFFPDQPAPELLRYVQDRDLWTWQLPDSREINEALYATTDHDFHQWSHLVDNWAEEKITFAKVGSIALDLKKREIKRLTDRPFWLEIDGHIVPAVNSPHWQSEIGEALCHRHPDAAFAAVWCAASDGTRAYSLRSRQKVSTRAGMTEYAAVADGPCDLTHDCDATAKKYGGGGHRQAAGFRTSDGFAIWNYRDKPRPRQATDPAVVECN